MVPEKSEGEASWIVGNGPRMIFTQPLNICLSDYKHFMIVMSVSPGIHSGASYMHIFYQLHDQNQYEEPISIAVQPDGIPHEYIYDLNLLNLDPKVRMSRFRFDPIVRGSRFGDTVITILDLRLIHSSEPSRCTD